MSSTGPDYAVAANAVDGNASTFAQSANESNPFLYVDLGEITYVDNLQVTLHETKREWEKIGNSMIILEKNKKWLNIILHAIIAPPQLTAGQNSIIFFTRVSLHVIECETRKWFFI